MKLAPLLEIVIKYLEFEFNYHQIGILNYIKFPIKKNVCTIFRIKFLKIYQCEHIEGSIDFSFQT
jgi:hypothetical protein